MYNNKNNEVRRYFNIVERGRWKLLQDATGVFWGVFSSYKKAKRAMDVLWYKYKNDIISRGIVKKDFSEGNKHDKVGIKSVQKEKESTNNKGQKVY